MTDNSSLNDQYDFASFVMLSAVWPSFYNNKQRIYIHIYIYIYIYIYVLFYDIQASGLHL